MPSETIAARGFSELHVTPGILLTMETISCPSTMKKDEEEKARSPQKSTTSCQRFKTSLCPMTFEDEKKTEGVGTNYFLILILFCNKDNKLYHRPFQMSKNMFQTELCHRITVYYEQFISQCICSHHGSY